MMTQTKKLIKKLKLKPMMNESVYSQSFIDRERKLMSELINRTEIKIREKTPAYLKKKNRMSDFEK